MKLDFKDPIFLASFPFYGYLGAYYYELGYLSAFNLPGTLVQVKIESVITFTSLLVFFFFIFVGAIDAVYPYYKDKDRYPIHHDLVKLTGPFLFYYFVAFFFKLPTWVEYIPHTTVILLVVVLIYLIMPLYIYRKKSGLGYLQKLRQMAGRRPKKVTKQVSILENFPRSLILLIVLAAIISIMGALTGEKDGREAKRFIVFFNKGSDYALLRNYGDEKIGVKIKDKKLSNEYILLKNLSGINFNLVTIEH